MAGEHLGLRKFCKRSDTPKKSNSDIAAAVCDATKAK